MLVQTKEKFSLSASFTKSIIPPHLTTNNQKLLRGGLNQWVSESVGHWVSGSEGEKGRR
jgi:hypothetical protein